MKTRVAILLSGRGSNFLALQAAVESGKVPARIVALISDIPEAPGLAKARELGLKVMVGCMTESTVGISAIAQLLPELDYVDMDGAMLLKEDIAYGVSIDDNGEVIFPDMGGTGVTMMR